MALTGGRDGSGWIEGGMEQGVSLSYMDESLYCCSTKLGDG